MRVLITSGGTKAPIDPVRDITNKSHGTFGSKIAREFLMREATVMFLHAFESRTPFLFSADCAIPSPKLEARFKEHLIWCGHYRRKYHEARFRNFDQYVTRLEDSIRAYQPDAIVLAAAVSDYLPASQSCSKIRTGRDLTIELTPALKVISKVRGWAPKAVIVGFKLLVGATDEELIEAATKTLKDNDCNLVVANDLESLQRGRHTIIIVEKGDSGITHRVYTEDVAVSLVTAIRNKVYDS